MGVNIPKLGNSILYTYQYDQLNRIIAMDAWQSNNSVWGSLSKVNDYKESIRYDPNGNIQTYLRNGTGSSISLNNYSYNYTANTNRLASISNSVNNTTGNYSYDAIGNTIQDDKQNIAVNTWNVYGKLQRAQKTNGTVITYTYAADGQRISKVVSPSFGGVGEAEVYVRDAGGNIMATYKKDAAINNNDLTVTAIYKYGSSLLDVMDARINVEHPLANNGIYTKERGNDNYILTDGNGNTKVTVSDKKIPHSSNGINVDWYEADIKTATLHSTYGANAKTFNGGFEAANFNGQRKSLEIGSDAQTALYWEYNGDVGRRWNVDPKGNPSISSYSTFANNPILLIDPNGADTVNIIKNKNGKWDILKTQIVKGDDIFRVKNGDNTKTYVFSEGEYGKRVEVLNLENTEDHTLGVYHISGSDKDGSTGYAVTPGGESSTKEGSGKRLPDDTYTLGIGDKSAKWRLPWVMKGDKNGDVSGRGIKIHFGYPNPKVWTEGCYVLSSDYEMDGDKIKYSKTQSKQAVRDFNTILGASNIYEYQGKKYSQIGAEYAKPILDYKLIQKDEF